MLVILKDVLYDTVTNSQAFPPELKNTALLSLTKENKFPSHHCIP